MKTLATIFTSIIILLSSQAANAQQGYAGSIGFMYTDFNSESLKDVGYAYTFGIGFAGLSGKNLNYDVIVNYNYYQNNSDGMSSDLFSGNMVKDDFDGITVTANMRYQFSPELFSPHILFGFGMNMLSSSSGRDASIGNYYLDWYFAIGGGATLTFGPLKLIGDVKYMHTLGVGDSMWPVSLTLQFHPSELSCVF